AGLAALLLGGAAVALRRPEDAPPAPTPTVSAAPAPAPPAEPPRAAASPEAARELNRALREPDDARRLDALRAWLARWPEDPERARAEGAARELRARVPLRTLETPARVGIVRFADADHVLGV